MSTSLETKTPSGSPAGRQTRGDARRNLLLQTTLRLIGEQGIAAVNHRSVAKAADVPLGSTTYWFGSRQEMLTEALREFVSAENATLEFRLGDIRRDDLRIDELVDAFTAHLMAQLGEDRWRTVAQYTLMQEAIRDPDLEAICREWTEAWTAALVPLFERLGADDPELESGAFLALLDGLLINQLATPDREPEVRFLRPALVAWFSRFDDPDPDRSRT
jgi:DNA-binding transcriptional regulator YbjK